MIRKFRRFLLNSAYYPPMMSADLAVQRRKLAAAQERPSHVAL